MLCLRTQHNATCGLPAPGKMLSNPLWRPDPLTASFDRAGRICLSVYVGFALDRVRQFALLAMRTKAASSRLKRAASS